MWADVEEQQTRGSFDSIRFLACSGTEVCGERCVTNLPSIKSLMALNESENLFLKREQRDLFELISLSQEVFRHSLEISKFRISKKENQEKCF